jgi:inorganic triphosphatase YgiF
MVAAAKDSGAAREVEIKLEFDPSDRREIEQHPLLAAAQPEKETLVSVYFDTEDRALWKAKLALRVRKIGPRYVQTLKGADGAAQLFDRPEWEWETSGLEPDLTIVEKTPLAKILDGQGRVGLKPLFRTRIDRVHYRVPSNAAEVEVAIDQGEIEADAQWSPVHELELELKHGEPADLFRLAREFAAAIPLRLAVKTKAERGYDLAGGATGGPEKAKPVALDGDMTCAQAFRAIGENCLRQIVANEPLVLAGEAEALHQMRIGLRRFRAAIALFAKMTADGEQERIKTELKWITSELGPARDLDVFTADILKPLAKDGGHEDANRAFAEARAKAYAAATGSIGSDRFRNALLDVAEWIEVGPWTVEDAFAKLRERKIGKHAAKRLARLRSDVRDKGEDLRKLGAKQRHKLRIKAKTLRYGVEFFASLYPDADTAKQREAVLTALKDMQDELGALNDIAQRQALASETLAGGAGTLGAKAAKLLAADEDEVDRLLKRAEAAFERFAKSKAFWT